jgi:hypothetical protein
MFKFLSTYNAFTCKHVYIQPKPLCLCLCVFVSLRLVCELNYPEKCEPKPRPKPKPSVADVADGETCTFKIQSLAYSEALEGGVPPPPNTHSYPHSPLPRTLSKLLQRDRHTSPHQPRLIASHSTCPPLSPSPHANSFVLVLQ